MDLNPAEIAVILKHQIRNLRKKVFKMGRCEYNKNIKNSLLQFEQGKFDRLNYEKQQLQTFRLKNNTDGQNVLS